MTRWSLFLLVLAASTGCGGVGNISGKISLQEQPLQAGFVAFYTPKGGVYTGQIDTEGNYQVSSVPVGRMKIYVNSHPRRAIRPSLAPSSANADTAAEMKALQWKPPPRGKYIAIPEKYEDPAQTPLEYEVRRGEQNHDIVLEP